MAETYQLKHTGEQIDALLDKAGTAVQPTDIPADIATQRELSDLAQTTDERLSDLAQTTDAKLTELSAEINGVNQEYGGDALTEVGYIDANGNYTNYNAYVHSPYIPIVVGSEITCTTNISASVSCVALYDKDKKWTRSLVGKNILATQSIVVEEGEAYMIMTSLVSNKQEYKVTIVGKGIKDDLLNLSDDIEDNSEAIRKALVPSTIILSHNVYDASKAENGLYYRWEDGVKVERSDIVSTGLIPCKSGDIIYVFRLTTYFGGNVTCWDKKGNFVIGINATTSPFTIPDNEEIAYFRTSFPSWAIDGFCININEKYEEDAYREKSGYFAELPVFAPNIEELQQSAESALKPSKVVLSHNVYDYTTAEIGLYYQWNTGRKIERSDISSTDFISCKAADKVFVFRLQYRYGGNVTFWSKDKVYLSGVDVVAGGDVSEPTFVVPDNAEIAFFKISFQTSVIDSLCININEKYADDAYREEDAYKSELPIYAPNLENKQEDDIVKHYTMTRDCVSSIYGRNNVVGSSFIFSVIAKSNYEGVAIKPRLKGTSDTNPLGDANITTVIAYAKKHEYQHVINAGIYLVADNEADGTTIIDGQILKDGACEQFTTNQYVLGIKADGTMKAYRDVSAQSIINDGCIDAVMGFVPLVEDGASVTDSILNICPHANVRHPRQIIGVLTTGDYFTFFCDGRTDNENGMTLRECVDTITNLANVQFAFNLDGGGSSQSVTYHKQINRMLDGRKVPNVIVFG